MWLPCKSAAPPWGLMPCLPIVCTCLGDCNRQTVVPHPAACTDAHPAAQSTPASPPRSSTFFARHPSPLQPATTRRYLWGLFPRLTSSACWQAAGAAGAAVGDNPALLVPPVKLLAPVLADVCTLAAPLQVPHWCQSSLCGPAATHVRPQRHHDARFPAVTVVSGGGSGGVGGPSVVRCSGSGRCRA